MFQRKSPRIHLHRMSIGGALNHQKWFLWDWRVPLPIVWMRSYFPHILVSLLPMRRFAERSKQPLETMTNSWPWSKTKAKMVWPFDNYQLFVVAKRIPSFLVKVAFYAHLQQSLIQTLRPRISKQKFVNDQKRKSCLKVRVYIFSSYSNLIRISFSPF